MHAAWRRCEGNVMRHRGCMLPLRAVLAALATSIAWIACISAAEYTQRTAWPHARLAMPEWPHGRALAASSSAEACISQGLTQVSSSCTTANLVEATGVTPRDSLIRLLQQCIVQGSGAQNTTRPPMRIFLAASGFATAAKQVSQVYSTATGIPIQVDAPLQPAYIAAIGADMGNAANYNKTHEAWGMYSIQTGLGIKSFKNITNLVTKDRRLNWEGLLPILRTQSLLYKGEVVTLPVSAFPYILFYRKDVFARHNISVPRTWRELVTISRRHNGTEGMHAFCGAWSSCTNGGYTIWRAAMASMMQTQGSYQGWLFDPDTMDLNLNTTASAEALSIVKSLYSLSPPDNSVSLGCPWHLPRYAAGECLMTVFTAHQYKHISHTSRAQQLGAVQGTLGMAALPGSELVFDRSTQTLVPCTKQRCPFATEFVNPDGSSLLVNQAPTWESSILAMNAHSKPDMSFFSYSVLSYLASEPVNTALVFNKDIEMVPCRISQLDPRRWQAAGYNLADATELSQRYSATFSHPNLVLQMRFPGAWELYGVSFSLINSLFSGVPIPAIIDKATKLSIQQLQAIYGTNTSTFAAEYWASLNRPIIAFSPPPPQPSPPPQYQAPDMASAPLASADRNTLSPGSIVLSVVLPLGVLVILAGLIIGYYRSTRLRRRGHPGAGPFTTLCVTDIEDSTLLWEEVDPRVMDTSVKLHNGCIRNLAAKHGGYESVWEGDSFVVAFHHPSEALSFCVEVQTELMLLPWPEALLQNGHASEVWCRLSNKLGAGVADGVQSKKGKSEPQIDVQIFNTGTCPASNHHTIPSSSIQRFKEANASNACSDLDSQRTDMKSTRSRSVTFHIPPKATHPDASDIPGPSSLPKSSIMTPSLPGSARNTLLSATDMLGTWHSSGASEKTVLGPRQRQQSNCGASAWMAHYWSTSWEVCARSTASVLAYKGLRVRLGIHSGVDSQACINFNPTMQRYHYTGPVRVISNAIASAGHGGHTLMSTSIAALLDTDGSGLLTDLPPGCGVYYQGKHVLSGVGEALDLLLVLPDALTCRLALQQARLRSQSTVIPGILSTPIPTAASADRTALVYVQFSGLSTLMAWDAEETRAALLTAQTALHDTMTACQGVLSEDGLQPLLTNKSGRLLTALNAQPADSVTRGRNVYVFSNDSSNVHPAMTFALAVQKRLLLEDWSEQLLKHELCEPMGCVGDAVGAVEAHWEQDEAYGSGPDSSHHGHTSAATSGPPSSNRMYLSESHAHTMPATRPPSASKVFPEARESLDSLIKEPQEPTSAASSTSRLQHAASGNVSKANLLEASTGSRPRNVVSPLMFALGSNRGITSASTMVQGTSRATSTNGTFAEALHQLPLTSGPLSRTASRNMSTVKKRKGDVTIEPPGLRGLRAKLVLVAAKGAEPSVATRSSGRVVFSGPPVKRAQKLLGKAKPGQVVVNAQLVAGVI